MSNKINISIPEPCHENWEAMTAVDKGKFCASCQKKVHDFTKASDREIVNAFQQNKNLCGRFLNTQLDRDLVKPNEKNSVWLATASALISFVGFGTQEAIAQGEPVKTEQTDRKVLGKFPAQPKEKITVKGQVFDEESNKLSEVLIRVKDKEHVIYTDKNGFFNASIEKGDVLIFSKNDFETQAIPFQEEKGHFQVNLYSYSIMVKSKLSDERMYSTTHNISLMTTMAHPG